MNTLENGIYAKFHTKKGNILVKLTYKETPATVGNFVALAEGKMKNSAKEEGIPFYDGLKFHRVIDNFMIQGGCPLGTGTGSPGYRFDDEFHPNLKHDKAGVLSMANAGPGTNGSQFFITTVPTEWLNGNHTIFGEVVSDDDLKVVKKLSNGDVMKKVVVEGDVDAFLKTQKNRVYSWNKTLKQNFPNKF